MSRAATEELAAFNLPTGEYCVVRFDGDVCGGFYLQFWGSREDYIRDNEYEDLSTVCISGFPTIESAIEEAFQ